MARPKAPLTVTDEQRQVLDSMAHRARTTPQLARRARIVLACASGLDNTTVAKKLRMSMPTVGPWRQRFIDQGVGRIARRGPARHAEEDRGFASRGHRDSDAGERATGRHALEHARPRESEQGQPDEVHRIWQAFGLQPHRTKTFKLSPDPLLIDKVRDIVGLHLNPPQHAAVFCVDERPQIQALDRTAPLLPMRPAKPNVVHGDRKH